MQRLWFGGAGIAVCLFPIALHGQSAWSRVPALPTGCYQQEDQFSEMSDKARQDLGAAVTRQQITNNALLGQLTMMDPVTKQTRMTAVLQKDPVNAASMQQSATEAQLTQRQLDVANRRRALEGKLESLNAEYVNESASLKSLWQRIDEAANRMADATVTEKKRYVAPYMAAYNAAYEKICAKWWSATSPFVRYLHDYKQFELEANIPFGDWYAASQRQQLDLYGVPATGYRSTAQMQAVREYLKEAQSVFQLRRSQPLQP